MQVLHAAETIKGGVATVMRALILHQTDQTGQPGQTGQRASIRALVPAEHQAELTPVATTQITTFRRTGRNLGSFLRFTWALAWLVARHKPDVVHLHSTFAGIIGRPLLLLLRPWHRPKVVYCPHGFSFIMEVSARKLRLYGLIEKCLTPLTDAIICVSHYEKRTALSYNLPAERLHVIYNGVDIPASGKPSSPKIDHNTPLQLLFVGRFDDAKGFDVILDLMHRLENQPFHLTAVGEGVHNREKPPMRPNITYAGWQTSAQLFETYRQADVLIMPSRWESFGLVTAAAMSHGLPVIASNRCSLPELVEHGQTGFLVDITQPQTLVHLLQTTPREEWSRLGAAARQKCQKSFTLVASTQATWQLYQTLGARA